MSCKVMCSLSAPVDLMVQGRKGRVVLQDFAAAPSELGERVLNQLHFCAECYPAASLGVEYVAYSVFFAPICAGQIPPLYRLHIDGNGFEFVKDEG